MRTGALGVWITWTGLYGESTQALFHHAPDAGLRPKDWIEAIFLLLQTMGYEKEKRAGTQAGDSASVQ